MRLLRRAVEITSDDPLPRASEVPEWLRRHSPAYPCTRCLEPRARPANVRRSPWVSVRLEEHLQHDSVFIHSAPQPVGNTTDEHVHFVQMPSQTSTRFTVTQSSSEFVTEVDALRADGFSRHLNATLEQEFFDIAVTQGVSVVQPDGAPDDRERESITGQLLVGRHRVTLPQTTCQYPQMLCCAEAPRHANCCRCAGRCSPSSVRSLDSYTCKIRRALRTSPRASQSRMAEA
jgi:hypothetical protein